MLTVHASGSDKMLRAAVDAAKARPELIVLAVTVLTSMGASDLETIGLPGSVENNVVHLARLGPEKRMPRNRHLRPRGRRSARQFGR